MPATSVCSGRPSMAAKRWLKICNRPSAPVVTRPWVMLFRAASSRWLVAAWAMPRRSSSRTSSASMATARAMSPIGPGSPRLGITMSRSWRATRSTAPVMPPSWRSTPRSTSSPSKPSAVMASPTTLAHCAAPLMVRNMSSASFNAARQRSCRHCWISSPIRSAATANTSRPRCSAAGAMPGAPSSIVPSSIAPRSGRSDSSASASSSTTPPVRLNSARLYSSCRNVASASADPVASLSSSACNAFMPVRCAATSTITSIGRSDAAARSITRRWLVSNS